MHELDSTRAERGLTLIELLTVLAVVGVVATLGVPRLLEATARLRVRMAAAEIATALHRTRSYAVCHSARVGLKFDTRGARVTWRIYRDGDGDGVLSRDIADGTDPPVGPGTPLARLGTSVRFGFPPGPPPRDPGDPRRRLDRLDDPIRFNRSDIASFTPFGGSTPGSVYITDGRRELAVVRVYGRTGKLRILVWNPREETWR
jgi:prepilin-type N-terminal cleavage/methylation domain-containing protein